MREPQNYFSDDATQVVTLPSDIIEQIDQQLDHTFKSRTEFIRAATMAYITKQDSTVGRQQSAHSAA